MNQPADLLNELIAHLEAECTALQGQLTASLSGPDASYADAALLQQALWHSSGELTRLRRLRDTNSSENQNVAGHAQHLARLAYEATDPLLRQRLTRQLQREQERLRDLERRPPQPVPARTELQQAMCDLLDRKLRAVELRLGGEPGVRIRFTATGRELRVGFSLRGRIDALLPPFEEWVDWLQRLGFRPVPGRRLFRQWFTGPRDALLAQGTALLIALFWKDNPLAYLKSDCRLCLEARR